MWEGIPFADLTPPVLVGIAFLLVMFGRLIPRPTYQDKVKEAEDWRKAYEKSEAARALESAQKAELLEVAKTTHSIVVALFGNGETHQTGGGRHALPTSK